MSIYTLSKGVIEREGGSRAAHADNAPVEFCFAKLLRRISSAIAKAHRFADLAPAYAFTLAEAILTMTILGIIAATMVTVLKPSQYNQQGFDTLKKKAYADLDRITQTILVECTQGRDATKIYKNCDRTLTPHGFGDDSGTKEASLYSSYMKGTLNSCDTVSGYTSFKLKNGVCIYFGSNKILVDVNGNNKPNEGAKDQMALSIATDGIEEDIQEALESTWDEGGGSVNNEPCPGYCLRLPV